MILCCGEMLIDMIPAATADGHECFRPCPGGAALNTAIALGRLGAPVGIVAGLSSDPFGARLSDILAASHVSLDFAIRSNRPTTLAFVHLDGGDARYSFLDEHSAGRMLREADMPAPGGQVAALFVTGIALAAEPCGSSFETFVTREAHRRVIVLDPNIRPAAIADRAAHVGRIERLGAVADIVKLSDDDLSWLSGDAEPVEGAQAWLSRGAKLVIVTHGRGGATAFSPAGSVRRAARPMQVVDTIGAGDTFDAAFLCRLLERDLLTKEKVAALSRETIADALDFAIGCARITVSREGADPPWRRELGTA